MRPVVSILALWFLACVSPIGSRSWLRVETPHFELISSAGRGRSVEIARGLELFRAAYAVAVPTATLEPRIPTLVYVFGDSGSFARFRTRSWLDGFMIQRPHRNFLAIDAGRWERALPTSYHEYVHFLLRNGGAVRYPTWYDEGFAEFLSTLAVENGKVTIGGIPPERGRWLLYGSLLSLRRIMTAGDVREWSSRALSRFYAQAWALTHFLYVAHHQGYPARYLALGDYLGLLNQGLPPDEACSRAFGATFEELERDFVRYVGEGRMPLFGLPLERLSVPEAWRAEPLPDDEKGYLLGDLALALGDEWLDEAERWLRLAVESEPGRGRTQAALGRVLARAGEADADAHLARALELAPEDPEVHRLYAESLLDRISRAAVVDEEMRLGEEARRHFRRSLELEPQQVAAHAGLGRSYLLLPGHGDAKEGLAALRTAHERLPADRSIALSLAQLELRVGALRSARRHLATMPPRSHGDPGGAGEQIELEAARDAVGLGPGLPRAIRHLESRLDVERPVEGERLRGLSGLAEVAGRAGLWESTLHDVVIAIDESSSTLLPTGADLDGDGKVGRVRSRDFSWSVRDYSTDPGDVVIRAELEAARALVRQLDPRWIRVAVVTFAGRADVLAPLGPPQSALEALEAYQVHVDPTGTSLALALAASLQAFVDGRDLDNRRQRTILLLSDGQPTVPSPYEGQRDALELADQLGEFGIPVHAFALGESALEDPEFYRDLAERSEGKFIPVEQPAEVVSQVADVRFTGLWKVGIRNLTTSAQARATRVFPDGSFDGYVPLEVGENELEITAYLEGAPHLTETRTIFFERPLEPRPEDRAAARALRDELERRTLELDLLSETRRRRRAAQQRALELEAEEPLAD